MRRIGLLSIIGILIGLTGALLVAQPAAVAMSFESGYPLLTAEQLQEHIQSPTQSDGIPTIDLRRYTIDLRAENEEFRNTFYRLLQEQLQQRSSPLGLDLSNSVIRGNLAMSSLGLRVPLYGQNLPTILSNDEQEQLQRDRRRLFQLSQLSRSLLIQGQPSPVQITVFRGPLKLLQTRFEGRVDFTNTFFLGRIDAQGAEFFQDIDGAEARFSQIVRFTGTTFQNDVRWRNSIFFKQIDFNQAQFQGTVTFQSSVFQATANFSQVFFERFANFSRIEWLGNADFAQSQWQDQAFFNKSKFAQALFLTKATFENRVLFREAQFNAPVNLRGASILGQADFGDATFASDAYLNVSGLEFNAEQAKILGNPGQIGRALSVPSLQGNETLLRNLVRNFRILEQIPDANQMEYITERLRLRKLRQRLLGTNLNTANLHKLEQVGLTRKQALAIINNRAQQPFQDVTDLLKLEEIDLATYVKVRDRTIADTSYSITDWIFDATRWLALSLLLLLTRYGTSFWLIFGIGILLTAYFGILFWVVDRLRRFHPQPIMPDNEESVWMSASFSILTLTGLSAIFNTAESPWLTLACLGLIGVPVPAILMILLYKQGRYHDLMTSSYFVQDGGARELRILIGRLPVIPQFAFFRDRYKPIPWERRWNWLNYFDFSLINLVRLGFNDIRLRDEYMPGLITSLVWYQWALGLLYIALLLWTLSRTIPGLNLLIYFK